jgi:hypothetical protein
MHIRSARNSCFGQKHVLQFRHKIHNNSHTSPPHRYQCPLQDYVFKGLNGWIRARFLKRAGVPDHRNYDEKRSSGEATSKMEGRGEGGS